MGELLGVCGERKFPSDRCEERQWKDSQSNVAFRDMARKGVTVSSQPPYWIQQLNHCCYVLAVSR